MKNKKGYYIQFDNSRVDSIFAIFDETEMVKALNWETKKFEPFALNQAKEYNFLNKCVFVNEQLYKYFRKRYLDEVIPFEDTKEYFYYVTFKEDGSVSNIYRKGHKLSKVEILMNDGEWRQVFGGNDFTKSITIDYDTFKFIVNECFIYSPEYILRNLKYMGRNILESDFQDKDFTDALFSNRVIGFNLLPQSVRTKYPTVNHIKDFLFPKKNEETVFGMDFGKGNDYTVFGTFPVYTPMPQDVVKLWFEEKFTPSEGLLAQLEKVRKDEIVDFIVRTNPLGLLGGKKTEVYEDESIKPKTKYQLSYSENDLYLVGTERTVTQIGYSRWGKEEVAQKLMFAIQEGKHLVVRNAENKIIAFFNKEQVKKMSFKFLKP